jgi:hypothetical protein
MKAHDSTSRPVSRLFRGSILAALFGWVSAHLLGLVWVILTHGVPTRTDWAALFVFPLYSVPFVLIVWLLALLPLYFMVPLHSILWRWPICTVCGALAGAVIMLPFGHPLSDFAGLAALIGGATCLFGSVSRNYFHDANDNTRDA